MQGVTLIWPEGALDETARKAAEDRLIRYADPVPVVADRAMQQRLAHWLHQPQPVPVAPVTASMDLADFDADTFWLRLDPVHLVPDRDTLVLFPAGDIDITAEEARALIDAFNTHFRSDGVRLEYGAPDRWYVRMPQPVDIRTVPLDQAVGANLHHVQPQGAAVRHWNRLINEAQMLFFQHPVNEARRQADRPEINGLWLWGEGVLPTLKPRSGLRIMDQHGDPFLRGLAALIDADYRQVDTLELAAHASSEALFAYLRSASPALWDELAQWLRQRQLQEALLDPGGDVAWHVKPAHLRRFWRRWFNPL